MDYVITYNGELFLSDLDYDEDTGRVVKRTSWTTDINYASRFVPNYAADLVNDIIESGLLDGELLDYSAATTDTGY